MECGNGYKFSLKQPFDESFATRDDVFESQPTDSNGQFSPQENWESLGGSEEGRISLSSSRRRRD
ncbi:hypothetical protein NC653_020504 [Populus alba x Populus x berolinensis]|uniref:Uncharacterized protein n=1 Tax=Populus alba x Populus x berolinensis TaxID=444605 RepID=A0AAD6QCH5_9ROSI|nr:hypothetical protein NC653_020504 [Populus alba x Populus x berolinensis]